MRGEYRLLETRNGATLFARVAVDVRPDLAAGDVVVAEGCGAPAWQAAAIAGAAFGSRAANLHTGVTIASVDATSVDTTMTAVAVAACQAVWLALRFQPSAEAVGQLNSALWSSGSPEELATLFEIRRSSG
jgi:hypothetical protein